ncbi:hypothetical protein K437DRAFT_258730 [Tilletiaria anomala UBC 951]|uniref:Uncharacterized protein n=1 Tax=Tilletiaria anomala (strain ATCC 24038 / CBS 436.72 / UBC 951) TaxID=1037660 RepID=A0A066VEU3_TILAU|nr:uncharacterized protein K437DRAFT_258730 [Tilletiaria anomala UBC 951]KDN40262.1 hypothetical protein K437DRAFT_258730 [Tilletiaria anomala UBC 951]
MSLLLPPRHERTPSPGAEDDDDFADYVESSAKAQNCETRERQRVIDPFIHRTQPELRRRLEEDFAGVDGRENEIGSRPKTSASAYRAFAAKRCFKAEGSAKVKRRDVELARREIQEFNDIVRNLQLDITNDWTTRLANDAALARYLKEHPNAPAGTPPKLGKAREVLAIEPAMPALSATREPDHESLWTSADILKASQERDLWRKASAHREDCFWPVLPAENAVQAAWTLGDEVEAIVERRWRRAVNMHLSQQSKAQHPQGSEGPSKTVAPAVGDNSKDGHPQWPSATRQPLRGSQTPQDGRSQTSPSLASIYDSEPSQGQREPEGANQPHQHTALHRHFEQLDVPGAILDPILTSTQLHLRRVLHLLPGIIHSRQRHLVTAARATLNWRDILQVLAVNTAPRKGFLAMPSPIALSSQQKSVLQKTEARLRAIYGDPQPRHEGPSKDRGSIPLGVISSVDRFIFDTSYLQDVISGTFESPLASTPPSEQTNKKRKR